MDKATARVVCIVAGIIGGVLLALSPTLESNGTGALVVAGVLIAVGFLGALLG